MSCQWLRSCHVLFLVLCTATCGVTVSGQEPAADEPGQQTPATAEADDAPAPAAESKESPAGEQPPAKKAAATEAAEKKSEPKKADESPESEAKPEAAKKDDPKPAPESPAQPAAGAEPAPSDPVADRAAFDKKLEAWKNVLKSLRSLTPRYSVATEEEAAAIEKEWAELIAEGERLIPELRATGKAAYATARGDRAVERFLTKLLADDINHDRYEEAYDLGTSMVANGCDVKEVLDAAGRAAFATNDFEGAEELLKRAADSGGISETGQQNLALVEEYKAHWEREQKLRAEEAAADDLPRVKVVTNRGEIVLELLENEAPQTVGNFINLIESKQFYDGLTFHRVLPGFMAQGGCPQGNGSGGPGYMIKCETDAPNHRKHFRGSLSMAHAGKDTGGSQFFLTFVPTAHLNGKHTVFGRVIEGMDVLAKIQRIDPTDPSGDVEPDKIIKMEVLRKRDHEYQPTKAQ